MCNPAAPLATLADTRSKACSGLCTPMTTNPLSRYRLYQSTTCGMARWQLMQEYAQKSIKTTLYRTEAGASGLPSGVLSHPGTPQRAGAGPHCCSSVDPSVQLVGRPLLA